MRLVYAYSKMIQCILFHMMIFKCIKLDHSSIRLSTIFWLSSTRYGNRSCGNLHWSSWLAIEKYRRRTWCAASFGCRLRVKMPFLLPPTRVTANGIWIQMQRYPIRINYDFEHILWYIYIHWFVLKSAKFQINSPMNQPRRRKTSNALKCLENNSRWYSSDQTNAGNCNI